MSRFEGPRPIGMIPPDLAAFPEDRRPFELLTEWSTLEPRRCDRSDYGYRDDDGQKRRLDGFKIHTPEATTHDGWSLAYSALSRRVNTPMIASAVRSALGRREIRWRAAYNDPGETHPYVVTLHIAPPRRGAGATLGEALLSAYVDYLHSLTQEERDHA